MKIVKKKKTLYFNPQYLGRKLTSLFELEQPQVFSWIS